MEMDDIIPRTLDPLKLHLSRLFSDLFLLFLNHKNKNEVCRTTDFFFFVPMETIRKYRFFTKRR